MNDVQTKDFASQLRRALGAVEEALRRAEFGDLSDLNGDDHLHLTTLLRGVVVRVAGPHSEYAKQALEVIRGDSPDGYKVLQLKGVATALLADLEAGALVSLAERLHGEVFADFIEMAQFLADEGLKDAAAVLTGGALEVHLRLLCEKNGIAAVHSTARESRRIEPIR